MTVTKNTLRRAARTFFQTAAGYICVNVTMLDFSQSREVVRSALTGLTVSAIAAGLSAVMNLEAGE